MTLGENDINFEVAKLVVAASGTILNALVIRHLWSEGLDKKSHRWACFNMAIADLVYALSTVVLISPSTRWDSLLWEPHPGDLGELPDTLFCRIGPVLEQPLSYTNLLCIVPLTVDRLVAVVAPTRYNTPKHRKIQLGITLATWFSPVLFCGAFLFYIYMENDKTLTVYNEEHTICTLLRCDPPESCLAVLVVLDFLTMILPLLFNIFSYTIIIHKLSQSPNSSSINTKIIVAKAFLTSLVFTCSWLPFFLIFRVLQNGNGHVYRVVAIFLLMNTITDPILNVTPNKAITVCLGKCFNLESSKRDADESTRSTNSE